MGRLASVKGTQKNILTIIIIYKHNYVHTVYSYVLYRFYS